MSGEKSISFLYPIDASDYQVKEDSHAQQFIRSPYDRFFGKGTFALPALIC